MKSYRKFAVIVSVSLPLLLVCTSLLADEENAEKPKLANWGWAYNKGNVYVILHVEMKGERYTDLILPPSGKMILPKGTVKVKVVSTKPKLEKTDNLEVDIRPAYYGPQVGWLPITESGKSRTFTEPTDAIPFKERGYLDPNVIVPPGAAEPTPEGALPSDWESPDEPEKEPSREDKKEPEKASKVDRKSRLLELNELYMKYSRRLAEIEPDSEEAKQIREALKKYRRDIDRYIAEEAAEHGPDWIETYRDENGKLPGGLIEDARSRLVKLREDMEKQKEKNAELEKEFERLKKKKDRDSENNRKLGRIIKQLAEEKDNLNQLQDKIKRTEKEASEEEEAQKRRAAKISDLDGQWRGDDFEWSSVTISNGKGISSFGRFEVQKKKLVMYYDFKPFSQSLHKGNRRYHRDYEFSGTWSRPEWSWSGLIGLHLYSNKVIHVVYETPKGYLSSGSFLREGPPPVKKDLPKEEQKEQSQEKSSVEER